MNIRRETRLGKFETQFFAWTQLRNKTLVATGDIATVLGLTPKQERELLSRMARAGLIVRIRNGLYMVPPKIPPGGKWTPGEYILAHALMEDAGAIYQIAGPTAFHQHGLNEQVPNNMTLYNDKISGPENRGIKKSLRGVRIEHRFAQHEIKHANTMVESFFRTLKSDYLRKIFLRDEHDVVAAIDFFVAEHNDRIPILALKGITPSECLQGKKHLPLQKIHHDTLVQRLAVNREISCSTCWQ